MTIRRSTLVGTLTMLSVTCAVLGGPERFKLDPAESRGGDNFGSTLAVRNSLAAIGTSSANVVYLFDMTDGQRLFTIRPADAGQSDRFGASVAIGDGLVVVGAHGERVNGIDSGSAYIFDATTGQELFKLLPSDGAEYDLFGSAVAIAGGIAIVGAPERADGDGGPGAVYVFDAKTGQQLNKLIASDGFAEDKFGRSVAIAGGIVVVGAPLHDEVGQSSGSVYLFDASTGQQLHKLLPTDNSEGDFFGASVAISGELVVIGAEGDDERGSLSGSAYAFDWTTGQELYKIRPSDGAAFDRFGSSVSIDGSFIVVGAYDDSASGNHSGSAYLFDAGTGRQLYKLVPSDGEAGDSFGQSIAISAGLAIVGAPSDDNEVGRSTGSAYIFSFIPCIESDLNFDDSTDTADLGILIQVFGSSGPFGDLDSNGVVEMADLGLLIGEFGAACP